MNLWAKRLGLPLLAALALFSCEEENTVGLPPEDNLGIFFAEIPMNDLISQVWVDNLPFDRQGRLIAGEYEDPQLGTISATAFADLSPTAFRSLIDPDSAQKEYSFMTASMTLRIAEVYGEQLEGLPNVSFSVYQLADTVDRNATYTNSSSIGLGEKIGEANFDFYLDSLNLEYSSSLNLDSTLFDSDSLYIYTTEFTLDQVFWENIFEEFTEILLDTVAYDDASLSATFDDLMKGIAIVGESSGTAITYNGLDLRSSVNITFEESNGSSNTERNMFFIVNQTKSFNEISPNANSRWTLSKFDAITQFYSPTVLNDPNVYIQSGANLFAAIDFSGFRNFADTAENTIFSEALLFVNGDETLLNPNVESLSQLQFLLASDETLENRELSTSEDVGFLNEVPTGIRYDEDSTNLINLPTYLNRLVLNQTELDRIILRGPSISSLSRLVIPKDSIFLRVKYSKNN